ncbi:tRNA lysidine(34) synthetase TilS [Luteimonas sp. A482]
MPGNAALALPPPPRARPLLVGYSGGMDSGALLHLLAADPSVRQRGLRAIHVHHGLHRDADAWARHCAGTCGDLEVALDVVRVEVARDGDSGLEAAARAARHAAFESTLRSDEVLVLGHHLDDQAETFLLRALRASGVDGLAAMRPWRRFGRGWMWRPLLDIPRARLLEHSRTHDLHWIEDPSNDSEAHDRNFLRRQVMPLLRTRWPHAGDAFAQAARLQRETSVLLEEPDAQALATLRTADPRCLHAMPLAVLPAARQARVLRRWVDELGLPPLPARGVAQVARLLDDGQDPRGQFAWHGAVIRRWRDLLRAGPVPSAAIPAALAWDGTAPLAWDNGELALEPGLAPNETFDAVGIAAPPFLVHLRSGGERITLPGRSHSHALKHVLQDLGVPPWARERLPLLSDRDGALLAAGDIAFSAPFDSWLRASGRHLRWTAPI